MPWGNGLEGGSHNPVAVCQTIPDHDPGLVKPDSIHFFKQQTVVFRVNEPDSIFAVQGCPGNDGRMIKGFAENPDLCKLSGRQRWKRCVRPFHADHNVVHPGGVIDPALGPDDPGRPLILFASHHGGDFRSSAHGAVGGKTGHINPKKVCIRQRNHNFRQLPWTGGLRATGPG